MNGATAVLGSALRVAATTAAASSLRRVASEAKMQLSLAILMGVAGLAGVICLSAAAFIVLRDQFGAAEAWSLARAAVTKLRELGGGEWSWQGINTEAVAGGGTNFRFR